MKVVYLHGLQSSPLSFKRYALERCGHEVIAPSLSAHSWEESVLTARETIELAGADVVIGSSRGGAVAMACKIKVPLVLIAPAWIKYCPWATISANTSILHSRADEVVAYEDSETLAHAFGATLIDVGACHRMNDAAAIKALVAQLDLIGGRK